MSSEEEVYTERVTELKKRRAVAKRNVTRLISKVNAAIEAKEEPTTCAAHLGEVFEVFKDVHFKLVELITDEDELDVANTYFEKVAHDVFDAESRVRASQDARQEPTMASTASTATDLSSVDLRAQAEKEMGQEPTAASTATGVSGVDLQAQAEKEMGQEPTAASISKEKKTSTPLKDATPRLSFGVSAVESMHLISEAIRSIMEESRVQQKEIVNSINTPRVEIIKYDGSPLKYYPFMRSFKNTIESRTQDNAIRLDTLIQHCTGDVNELLQCCLIKEPDEGYELAMKMLKDTYGDHDIIASAWLDRILKRPKLKSVKELGKYVNDLKTCCETLEAMDYLPELQTRTHLKAIADKLPDRIYNRWAKASFSIKEKEGRPGNLKEMIKFLDRVSKEASDATFPTKETDETSKPRKQIYATNSSEPETLTRKPVGNKCRKCGASHYLNQCDRFRALTVAERIEFVKENELCSNCFQPDHQSESCPRSWRCNIEGCGAKHNRWLHTSRTVSGDQSANHHGTTKPRSDPTLTVTATNTSSERTLLPVTTVLVKGPTGRVKRVSALFDNGSTGSMCSEALVEELLLPYKDTSASLTTVDREDHSIDCKLVDFEIQNLQASYSFKMRKVMTRESLNIHHESYITEKELTKLPHLLDLEIPKIETEKVDLLIGQDHSELLVPLEVRRGKENEPFAIRTHLGWVFNGNLAPRSHKSYSVNFIDARLDEQVEKFWALDDPFSPDDADLSVDDRKVIAQWENSIELDDNHYSLPIPFKQRPPSLPNNKSMAKRRLALLGKRLNKDNDLKQKYISSITDTLQKGYAERVPDADMNREDGSVWYLPHHPVLHPHKPGKVRVVFDCAAKFLGVSLNDRVHQGPDLANKLVGVLLRFRQEPVAIMADIEAMFSQVKVHESDRDVLRFLWWPENDINKEPDTYRMTTHLFGGVWSPSCANFALKRAADESLEKYDPETVLTIFRNFYVDDCLKSVSTEQQAIRLIRELRNLLSSRGFHLTKFISNSKKVLKTLPNAELSKAIATLDLDRNNLPSERALGVLWDVENDHFTFSASVKANPFTKRGILSTMSSIYDPLGFLSPFVLPAKMIFQTLCRHQFGWDEKMPAHLTVQWQKWLDDLPIITKIKVPRCLLGNHLITQTTTAQLHHFSDASEGGFGAVSYLRWLDSNSQIHCSLVMAKSKLAPIKPTTIPRLELSAAVVSIRLDKTIREHLQLTFMESVYWTDSMIVLQYIRNTGKRFQTFVANRIAAIHSHSDPTQWQYIDTKTNPADDVSRGMTADELRTSERWVQGPSFLWQAAECWPAQPDLCESDELEIKKEPKIYYVQDTRQEPLDKLISKYSSWHRLKKAVAWIIRLKRILCERKSPPRFSKCITLHELHTAEMDILRYAQQQTFLCGDYRRLAKLSPTSINGTIRVGGRLSHAPVAEEASHQIILPANHHVTTLIIRHCHVSCAHGGIERTLAEVRQKYWNIKGRSTVRRVIRECVACRRSKAPTQTQKMSDLPSSRVTPNNPPFTKVGVDYFGPFLVKRGRCEHKRYGCVFTCFTTRAVHLEVAHSLETDSFINALQRFISRRGQPMEITSDNGTNFVGAKRELTASVSEWNQRQIHEYLLQKGIVWIFNPPAASHMGGVWERHIRTIRSLMLSLFKQQTLSDESLLTLMCNIENIINNRPITKLSDDPTDPLPLTPNHLLMMRSTPDLPPGKFVKEDMYRRRWRQVQYLADLFWTRWLREYLPTLQQRQRWLKPRRNIAVGDLVLIAGENTPRHRWPLGLVMDVYPGRDGLVRSVKVKSQAGVYERPISKLCLLEAATEDTG